MTRKKTFKSLVRERQELTGENYTTAMAAVREGLPLPAAVITPSATSVMGMSVAKKREGSLEAEATASTNLAEFEFTALVLAAKGTTLTLRDIGSGERVTLRASEYHLWEIIPGELVRVLATKKWTWRKHAYVSGNILKHWTNLIAAGIKPLALDHLGETDFDSDYDPVTRSDPNYKFWKKSAQAPRQTYEFEDVAWGIVNPDNRDAPENMLTCDAAEMLYPEDARELLMEALSIDVRCVDAHAHLGTLCWKRDPERGMRHYQMGIDIAELSLPQNFEGVLPWGHLNNRPYLRALHGFALCQWRLGRVAQARRTFERILELNPVDNQGVRFCWDAIRKGKSWAEFEE